MRMTTSEKLRMVNMWRIQMQGWYEAGQMARSEDGST